MKILWLNSLSHFSGSLHPSPRPSPKGEGEGTNVTAKLTLAVRPRQDCCNSGGGGRRLQSRSDDKALALPCFQRALRETPCGHRHVYRTPAPFATVARQDLAGETRF